MKIQKEVIDTILNLNLLILTHTKKGNRLRVRFYQSLLSWVISKQLKSYGSTN